MPTRRAILIESSQTKHGDLPGAREDVKNLRKYLLTNIGGAWVSSEIVILSTPSKSVVQSAIEDARKIDYVIMSFSGHGHHKVGKDLDETSLILNNHEEIPVHELNPCNDRGVLIVDACRGITPVLVEEKKSFFAKAAASVLPWTRAKFREYYDLAIAHADKGQSVLYSCNVEESAGDTPSGGLFSRSLIRCADNWGQLHETSTNRGVYTVRETFDCAAAATTTRRPQQHPQYNERRIRQFPFAVVA